MKLSVVEQKVLDYVRQPRTAQEIAKHFGLKRPPYDALRLLRRLGLVNKIGSHPNAKSTFVATGD